MITRFPFVALFTELISIVAPEYFDNGEPSLEAGKYYFPLYQSKLYFFIVCVVFLLHVKMKLRIDLVYIILNP